MKLRFDSPIRMTLGLLILIGTASALTLAFQNCGPAVDFQAAANSSSSGPALGAGGTTGPGGVSVPSGTPTPSATANDFTGGFYEAQGDVIDSETYHLNVGISAADIAKIYFSNNLKLTYRQMCILKVDATLWCWGTSLLSDEFSLGSGTAVRAVKVASQVDHAAIASDGLCWVKRDGSLHCFNARVATGITAADVSASGVVSVQRTDHICFLKGDKGLYCYGKNNRGQIGNGSASDVAAPVKVMDDVSSFSVGIEWTCALNVNKQIWCWGSSQGYGEAVGGTVVDHNVPVLIKTDPTADSLIAGPHNEQTMCSLSQTGRLTCFGYNLFYSGADPNPWDGVKAVYESGFVKCVLLRSGEARCSGDGGNYGAGPGVDGMPTQTTKVLNNVVDIFPGDNMMCFKMKDARIRCQGYFDDVNVALMGPSFSPISQPVSIASGVLRVHSFFQTTCTISVDHDLDCWSVLAGIHPWPGGQFPQDLVRKSSPHHSFRGEFKAYDVANVLFGTCILNERGELICWGGAADFFPPAPGFSQAVSPTGYFKRSDVTGARNLVAGENFICFVNASGGVSCLGSEFQSPSYQRVDYALTNVAELAAGSHHVCARTDAGEMYCWGANLFQQITMTEPAGTVAGKITAPLLIASGVARLAVGIGSSCGLMNDRRVQCFAWAQGGVLATGVASLAAGQSAIVGRPQILGVDAAAGASGMSVCYVDTNKDLYCGGVNLQGFLGPFATATGYHRIDSQVESVVVNPIGTTCYLRTSKEAFCMGSDRRGTLGSQTHHIWPQPISFD